MALQFRISNAVAKALADAFTTQLDAGAAALLRIYTGAIPANVDDGVGAETLLAELTMSATSFGAATDGNPGGLITANAITQDSSANATGTAGFFVLITQNAGTLIAMGSVGTATADLILNTVSITAGSAVAVTAFTITMPES